MIDNDTYFPREKREVMTPHEVANELQIGLVKVRQMFRTKELRGFKIGKHLWRMFRTDFQKYLEERKPSS